jgi:hypothetical protein
MMRCTYCGISGDTKYSDVNSTNCIKNPRGTQHQFSEMEVDPKLVEFCDYCGVRKDPGNEGSFCTSPIAYQAGTIRHLWVNPTIHPEGQGKRTIKRARHDLIPIEFLDEIASIFEEGLEKYGDSWKKGGRDFLIDCLNHASNHFHKYCNGDTSENQLSKVAWNCLVVRYFDLKGEGLNGQTRNTETK